MSLVLFLPKLVVFNVSAVTDGKALTIMFCVSIILEEEFWSILIGSLAVVEGEDSSVSSEECSGSFLAVSGVGSSGILIKGKSMAISSSGNSMPKPITAPVRTFIVPGFTVITAKVNTNKTIRAKNNFIPKLLEGSLDGF